MSATFDFERKLAEALEYAGPSVAPRPIVDAALAQASSIRQRRPMVSLLDRRTWPAGRFSLGNPATARLALLGLVALLTVALVATAIGIGSQLLPKPAVWLSTGALSQPHDDSATLTLLADGRVLATGGINEVSTAAAEVYDPSTGIWTVVDDMLSARNRPSATLLPNGLVLIAGGAVLPSAELFDPATGGWTATGSMNVPRSQHAAILMPSGEVLVAGGTTGEPAPRTAELYDPITETWTATGVMTTWRASPTITLLQDGTVLVAGGYGNGVPLRTAEVYDPVTELWRQTSGDMMEDRVDDHTATLLPDGMVLVAGGERGSAELYDPALQAFTTIAPMLEIQRWATATLLPDGKVLVAGGGLNETTGVTAVERYDPATGSWTAVARLVEARAGAKAVLLRDGSVLIVGGIGVGGPLASVERYGGDR
ncbi:MAG: kelch repeat-containing protein [Candidatus Limnocylindrales bacterium]